MSGIILAALLFAVPALPEPVLTVYAEPVAEVVYVEVVEESVEEFTDTVDDMECTHGAFVEINDCGDYMEGICECGEVIRWTDWEDFEDEEEDVEDPEDPACEWVENGNGGLDCTVHGCHAWVLDESDEVEDDEDLS